MERPNRNELVVWNGMEASPLYTDKTYLKDLETYVDWMEKQLSIHVVVKPLPEWKIYQKAQELDEKEFEQWMYDNQ